MRHDTVLGAATRTVGAKVAIQIWYCDRKGPATRPCVAIQHCNKARQHARARSDTAGHRL